MRCCGSAPGEDCTGSIGPGWGNGKAAAVLYAREGAKIIASDINPEAAAQTAALIHEEGNEASVFEADVSDSAQVAESFD